MKHSLIALFSLLSAIGVLAADVPDLPITTIGIPHKTSRMGHSATTFNAAGQPIFIGAFMNYKGTTDRKTERVDLPNGNQYYRFTDTDSRPDAEWVIANLETGEVTITDIPGFHTTNACRAPNGRVFFNMDFGQVLYYEPADNTIKMLGNLLTWVPYDNYRMLYRMVLGPDGYIYGTAQSNNRCTAVLRINPDTLEHTLYDDLGTGTRDQALTYGYWMAIEPPWVYVAVGQSQWELYAIHTETGEKRLLAQRFYNNPYISFDSDAFAPRAKLTNDTDPGIDLQGKDSRTVGNILYTKKRRVDYFWCVDGKLEPFSNTAKAEDLTFTPRAEREIPAFTWTQTKPQPTDWKLPTVDTKGIIIGADGSATIPWKPADDEGDYRHVPFQITRAEGVPIETIAPLPDGSLLGVCQQYRGNFRYYPADNRLETMGSFGSRPAIADLNGTVYLSSYPNCQFGAYDPTRPWSIPGKPDAPEANPRRLDYFSNYANTHHAYVLAAGPDSKRIYMMGLRERRATGTGIGYYQPADNTYVGLRDCLPDRNPRGFLILPKHRRIVVSGQLLDTTGDEPPTADLVVYDLELKELSRHVVQEHLTNTGTLYPGHTDTDVIGIISSKDSAIIYRYDIAQSKLLVWKEIPNSIGAIMDRDDGTRWIFSDTTLCRIDPETLVLTPVGNVTHSLAHGHWVGDTLYGARGHTFQAIKGL